MPSIGTVGDAYDNALAETTIGLYKTECTREDSPFRDGPLETVAQVERVTSEWVHWYNTSRLMHRLGRRAARRSRSGVLDRGGLDQGTLAMTLIGLPGAGQEKPARSAGKRKPSASGWGYVSRQASGTDSSV